MKFFKLHRRHLSILIYVGLFFAAIYMVADGIRHQVDFYPRFYILKYGEPATGTVRYIRHAKDMEGWIDIYAGVDYFPTPGEGFFREISIGPTHKLKQGMQVPIHYMGSNPQAVELDQDFGGHYNGVTWEVLVPLILLFCLWLFFESMLRKTKKDELKPKPNVTP